MIGSETKVTITVETDDVITTYEVPKALFFNIEVINEAAEYYYSDYLMHTFQIPDYKVVISMKPKIFNNEGHMMRVTKKDV